MDALFNNPQLLKAVQQAPGISDRPIFYAFLALLACELALAAFIIIYETLKFLAKTLKKVFQVLMFLLGVLINVGFTVSLCLLAHFAYMNPEVIMEFLKHGFKILSESF